MVLYWQIERVALKEQLVFDGLVEEEILNQIKFLKQFLLETVCHQWLITIQELKEEKILEIQIKTFNRLQILTELMHKNQ